MLCQQIDPEEKSNLYCYMIYFIKPIEKDNLFWNIVPGYIWEV